MRLLRDDDRAGEHRLATVLLVGPESPASTDPTLAAACDAFLAEQDARHAAGGARASTPRYYRENTRVRRTRDVVVDRDGGPLLDERGRAQPRYAHDPDDPHREPFADLRLSELDPLAIGRYLRPCVGSRRPGRRGLSGRR